MLIRKTQQPSTYPENQIHDAYSTSATDTYSCNYINEKVIEESGNNYVKYGDGTLICWGKTNLVNISAYGSEVIDINLPYSYKDTNYLVITSITDTGPYWANGFTVAGYPTSEDKIRLMLGNYLVNATVENVSGGFITIGKWK